jgi:hypothetical protein
MDIAPASTDENHHHNLLEASLPGAVATYCFRQPLANKLPDDLHLARIIIRYGLISLEGLKIRERLSSE